MNFLLSSCVVIMLYLSASVCNTNSSKHASSNQYKSDQDSLIMLANKLETAFDNKKPLEFFELFPKTFSQFNQLYGFDDKKGECILYKKYQEHIGFICDNNNIPLKDKLSKMIAIGVNGKWDADAVSMLQQCTLNLIKDNVKISLQILNGLSKSDILNFWTYLFDGPHPNDEVNKNNFNTLHKSIMTIDSAQAKLMEQAFKNISGS